MTKKSYEYGWFGDEKATKLIAKYNSCKKHKITITFWDLENDEIIDS